MTAPDTLEALGRRLARDLECLEYPPTDWVRPNRTVDGARVVDVVIVGAGMCGLTAAFALKREGISNIRILDRSPGGLEGPWKTFARMETLRSPKHLAGPAMGVPALTFRAWYEAQWGEEGWETLGRIPREMWMDYLVWYRQVLDLPVENERTVTQIVPAEWGVTIQVRDVDGAIEEIPARRVVLASGRDGMAQPRIPEALADVPRGLYHHSSDEIDFSAMRGRDVAVIGIGASALDNAAEALEVGARSVHVLARTPDLPLINKAKGIVHGGFNHGFSTLGDRRRWEIFEYILGVRVPPPHDTALRVTRHPNFRLHLGTPLELSDWDDAHFSLRVTGGDLRVDHLILGTGFRITLEAAAELSHYHDAIARWRDQDIGRPVAPGEEFGELPYLGPAYEFQAAEGEDPPPGLGSIHCFNHGGFLSHGYLASDIPGVSEGARRLARGIAGAFFREDADWQFDKIRAFDLLELEGDEFDRHMADSE